MSKGTQTHNRLSFDIDAITNLMHAYAVRCPDNDSLGLTLTILAESMVAVMKLDGTPEADDARDLILELCEVASESKFAERLMPSDDGVDPLLN